MLQRRRVRKEFMVRKNPFWSFALMFISGLVGWLFALELCNQRHWEIRMAPFQVACFFANTKWNTEMTSSPARTKQRYNLNNPEIIRSCCLRNFQNYDLVFVGWFTAVSFLLTVMRSPPGKGPSTRGKFIFCKLHLSLVCRILSLSCVMTTTWLLQLFSFNVGRYSIEHLPTQRTRSVLFLQNFHVGLIRQ